MDRRCSASRRACFRPTSRSIDTGVSRTIGRSYSPAELGPSSDAADSRRNLGAHRPTVTAARRNCAGIATAEHRLLHARLRRLMVTIQPTEQDGQLVALVAGGRALIDEQLAGDALALVQAKCLYALEIEAQTLPGPYAEPAASRF